VYLGLVTKTGGLPSKFSKRNHEIVLRFL